jgi:hypothetical protein
MRPNGKASNSESMTIWRVSSESGEQVRKLGDLILGELIGFFFQLWPDAD